MIILNEEITKLDEKISKFNCSHTTLEEISQIPQGKDATQKIGKCVTCEEEIQITSDYEKLLDTTTYNLKD